MSEWEDWLYQHIPPTIPNINKSDEEEDNKIAQDLHCNVFPWFIRRPSSHSVVLYLCCTIIMRRKKTSESEMNTKYFTIIHGFSLSIHLFSLTSCVFTRPATAAALSLSPDWLYWLICTGGALKALRRREGQSLSHPSSIHTNISLPSSFGEQAGRQAVWVGGWCQFSRGRVTLCPRVYSRLSAAGHYYAHRVVDGGWQAGINARSNLFRLLVYRFDALPVLCHMKEASSITGSSSEIRNERMCTVVCSAVVVGSIIRIYLRLWAN